MMIRLILRFIEYILDTSYQSIFSVLRSCYEYRLAGFDWTDKYWTDLDGHIGDTHDPQYIECDMHTSATGKL